MKYIGRFVLITTIILSFPSCGSTKLPHRSDNASKNQNYVNYINRYSKLAVQNMYKYRIPASITLAQGLLESNAGMSQLALKANNHFGIKCGGTWSGPSMAFDDDAPGECFRSYNSPESSYYDHSVFLTTRSRYAFLFNYPTTDYKNWARGLKKAGYATNPAYANTLISLIERYNLDRYDNYVLGKDTDLGNSAWKRSKQIEDKFELGLKHRILMNNGLYYVIARTGDTFETLGKELDISPKKLIKYNELFKGYPIKSGDILYLSEKKKKADKKLAEKYHVVTNGESIYTIAQKYGIRMKDLYKLNNADPQYFAAKEGALIRIR